MLPPNAQGKLDVGGAIGNGVLTVIKDLGLKEPYSGQTNLITGEIAEDLTYYFASSEQIPTSVALGVLMNKENTVRQAGGFMIQMMPFASDEVITALEDRLKDFTSVTSHLDRGETPEDMMADSTIYLRVYFLGIIFTLVYNMGAAIMRAAGDSRRPLLYLVVCSVMNIILDIVMVVFLHMGIAGAALATVISQCISAALVTYSLMHAYDVMKLKLREIRMNMSVLAKELKIGIPGALQACAYGVTNVIIQAVVNGFGTDTAAGWAAYGKLDMIFWTVNSALGVAVTTFVGQNYGAGKMDRVYKSIRVNLGISYLFNGVVLIVLYVFCEPLYHLFTTDQAVIDIGVYMLRFLVPSYLLSVLLENLTGGLRGLGDVLWPTIFTFAGLFFVRLPWTMIMTQLHHNVETLLISYPLAWGTTIICLIPYYFWRKKKKMSQIA